MTRELREKQGYRPAGSPRKPGVSIAIPNWNHEHYLPKAIASALEAADCLHEHGYFCEILVVDDNSRDGSLVLLRQLEALYFEKGLRLIALERNGGVVEARNHAIQAAEYEYLLFLDADNEIIAENLPQFVRAIVQTKAAVVYGNMLVYHESVGFTGLISNEAVQSRLLQGNYIDVCALYAREALLELGGFSGHERMQAHEDWDLFLHMSSSGREIVFVPLLMGKYNFIHSSNITQAIDDASIQRRMEHLSRVYDQRGIRDAQRFNSKHLRYHPDIGYI